MTDDREWVDRDGYSFDPGRWNPDDKPSKCQVCGEWLDGQGDGSTMGQRCPECDVQVWIR